MSKLWSWCPKSLDADEVYLDLPGEVQRDIVLLYHRLHPFGAFKVTEGAYLRRTAADRGDAPRGAADWRQRLALIVGGGFGFIYQDAAGVEHFGLTAYDVDAPGRLVERRGEAPVPLPAADRGDARRTAALDLRLKTHTSEGPTDAGARATEAAPVSGETSQTPGHQAGGGFPCAFPDGHDGKCVAMSPADKARRDATDCLPSCARWPGHAGRCSDVPLAGSPPASTDTAADPMAAFDRRVEGLKSPSLDTAAPVSGETHKPPPWTPDELQQLEYMARRRRQIRVENGLPPEEDRRTHIADATSDLMASVKGEA